MHKNTWWRSPLALPSALLAAALFIFLACFGWQMASPDTPTQAPSAPGDTAPASRATAAEASAEAPRNAAPLPATAAAPAPTFEERIDELVRLGQQTAAFAAQDDPDAATESDRIARARFTELMERFQDAGERGLGMVATLHDAKEPETHGRKIVLQLVVFTECERRNAAAATLKNRARLDPFVQSILDSLPMHEAATAVGAFALVQRPFLRACHEPGVLGLVQLAAEERFSREVATRLLLTLWDNMQLAGERTSDELSRLALLHLEHGDPSQRTAAYRQLLKDERYRNLVLAWLREKNDQGVAHELANLAANELPPKDAIALLRELSPVLSDQATAFLTLAFRDGNTVADGYRELLAANTHPTLRRDMIIGAGMPNTPLALELSLFALENDPAVEVRVHAVMSLSGRTDAEVGERAIQRALDDPAIANDPVRVGEMVFALQNLEARGHTNAVDRLGQRLQSMTMLSQSKELLARILSRSLPGGLPSGRPGGPPR